MGRGRVRVEPRALPQLLERSGDDSSSHPWLRGLRQGSGSEEGGCRESIMFEFQERPLRKRKKQRN